MLAELTEVLSLMKPPPLTLGHPQVEAALLSSSPVPVIEYTVIPIDTSNCDRPTLSK